MFFILSSRHLSGIWFLLCCLATPPALADLLTQAPSRVSLSDKQGMVAIGRSLMILEDQEAQWGSGRRVGGGEGNNVDCHPTLGTVIVSPGHSFRILFQTSQV